MTVDEMAYYVKINYIMYVINNYKPEEFTDEVINNIKDVISDYIHLINTIERCEEKLHAVDCHLSGRSKVACELLIKQIKEEMYLKEKENNDNK